MYPDSNLHTLTHGVINDLQQAFGTCHDSPTGGFILSAMVTAKKVHDRLIHNDQSSSDLDPEEYCAAI